MIEETESEGADFNINNATEGQPLSVGIFGTGTHDLLWMVVPAEGGARPFSLLIRHIRNRN